MKQHELKTDPDVFQASWDELKAFEIRNDDRNFCEGDTLLLRETTLYGHDIKNGSPLEYTGRRILQSIDYVLRGPIYGLKEGWVILSICNKDFLDNEDDFDGMTDQTM